MISWLHHRNDWLWLRSSNDQPRLLNCDEDLGWQTGLASGSDGCRSATLASDFSPFLRAVHCSCCIVAGLQHESTTIFHNDTATLASDFGPFLRAVHCSCCIIAGLPVKSTSNKGLWINSFVEEDLTNQPACPVLDRIVCQATVWHHHHLGTISRQSTQAHYRQEKLDSEKCRNNGEPEANHNSHRVLIKPPLDCGSFRVDYSIVGPLVSAMQTCLYWTKLIDTGLQLCYIHISKQGDYHMVKLKDIRPGSIVMVRGNFGTGAPVRAVVDSTCSCSGWQRGIKHQKPPAWHWLHSPGCINWTLGISTSSQCCDTIL